MGRLAYREHCKFCVEDPHKDHVYRSVKGAGKGREERGLRSRGAKV